MPGAGASSITFWWRRCSEQSRSNRCRTVPCVSANTCISMCRGEPMYFSTSTRPSPKALSASRPRARQGRVEFGGGLDPAHALAAAAGDRLDQDGVADHRGLIAQEGGILPLAVIARHDRDAGRGDQRLGPVLEAHGPHGGRRRADESDAARGAGFRELGALGEEAVARMDRGGARPLRHVEYALGVQIAVAGRRRADRMRLVGHCREQRARIRLRMHGDRAQAEAPRGADDAAGDLAAIGDEDRFEHARSLAAHATPLRPCNVERRA